MKSLNAKALVLALGLSTLSFTASAAEYAATVVSPTQLTFENLSPAPSFTDWVSFSFSSTSSVLATISGTSSLGFSLTSFDLYDGDKNFITNGVINNVLSTASLGLVLSNPSVSGTYFLYVAGTTSGGTYNGNISITPVPEPESYAMMLAGLGLMGFVARRRKN